MKVLKIVALAMMIGFGSQAMAQGWMDEPPPGGPPFGEGPRAEKIRERIKTVKVWKLTEDLNLTPDQSEKFFPLYNKFESDREAIEKQRRQTFVELEQLTDQENPSEKEIDVLIDKLDSYEGRIQDLRVKFRNDLKDILTTQQIGRLYVFEVQFMRQMREIIRDARMEMRGKHFQDRQKQ